MLIYKEIIVPRGENSGELEEEDGREAEAEFGVLGLMVPDFHTEQSTDAAAGDGYPEQACLGDAPLVALCLPFVNAIQEKRDDVDSREINQYGIEEVLAHLLIFLHLSGCKGSAQSEGNSGCGMVISAPGEEA